jgi:hypothetical protein
MESHCSTPDVIFPMKADIYFPIVTQGEYGQPKKDWVYDRTITCSATPIGGAGEESIKPESFLQYKDTLIGRTKNDPRVSSHKNNNAVTNILVTNIRAANDYPLYIETAGVRSGRGTIYEVATVEPFIGPFQEIEYYKMVLRRTENQTVGD